MRIGVFCSANDLGPVYQKPAQELAALLGRGAHTLVYGGVELGLMKVLADGVRQHGGRIVGIPIKRLEQFIRDDVDELILAQTLSERKALLLKHSDALIALVGGLGTIDEITEILEHKRQGLHDMQVVVLNTNGFYDGLQMQFERMAKEDFLPKDRQTGVAWPPAYWIRFAATPAEALRLATAVSVAT